MKSYNFAIFLAPFERPAAQVEGALSEAGCTDATLRVHGTTPVLEFDRFAVTLEAAIVSALRDAVDAGTRPIRIEPDDLVSASEISRRAGVTREAVRLWIEGHRCDSFPGSRAMFGRSKVWSWLEVSRWLAASDKLPDTVVQAAAVIAGFNLALELRHARREPEVWGATSKLLDDVLLAV